MINHKNYNDKKKMMMTMPPTSSSRGDGVLLLSQNMRIIRMLVGLCCCCCTVKIGIGATKSDSNGYMVVDHHRQKQEVSLSTTAMRRSGAINVNNLQQDGRTSSEQQEKQHDTGSEQAQKHRHYDNQYHKLDGKKAHQHDSQDDKGSNKKDGQPMVSLPYVGFCQPGGWATETLIRYKCHKEGCDNNDDESTASKSSLPSSTSATITKTANIHLNIVEAIATNTKINSNSSIASTSAQLDMLVHASVVVEATSMEYYHSNNKEDKDGDRNDDSGNSNATNRNILLLLQKKVLPRLHCDFREGDIRHTTRQWPIHRSSIELISKKLFKTKLKPDDNSVNSHDGRNFITNADAIMMLRCNIPTNVLYYQQHLKQEQGNNDELNNSFITYKLPNYSNRREFDSNHGLHWQLSSMTTTTQNNNETKHDEWFSFVNTGPSKSLCIIPKNNGNVEKANGNELDVAKPLFTPTYLVNPDLYQPRVYNINNSKNMNVKSDEKHSDHSFEAMSSNSISSALCIIPSSDHVDNGTSSSFYEKYSQQDLLDWLYYQRHILGFQKVFYIDEYGNDFIGKYPLLQNKQIGFDLVHIPHYFDGPRNKKAVTLIAKQRCTMLASYYYNDINYIAFQTYSDMFTKMTAPMNRRINAIPTILTKSVMQYRHQDYIMHQYHKKNSMIEKEQDDSLSSSPFSLISSISYSLSYRRHIMPPTVELYSTIRAVKSNTKNSPSVVVRNSTNIKDDKDIIDDDDAWFSSQINKDDYYYMNDNGISQLEENDIISTFLLRGSSARDVNNRRRTTSSSRSTATSATRSPSSFVFYHVPSLLESNMDMGSMIYYDNNSTKMSKIHVSSRDAMYIISTLQQQKEEPIFLDEAMVIEKDKDIDKSTHRLSSETNYHISRQEEEKEKETSIRLSQVSNWVRILLEQNNKKMQHWLALHTENYHPPYNFVSSSENKLFTTLDENEVLDNKGNSGTNNMTTMDDGDGNNDSISSSRDDLLSSSHQYEFCSSNEVPSSSLQLYGKAIVLINSSLSSPSSFYKEGGKKKSKNYSPRSLELTFYDAEVGTITDDARRNRTNNQKQFLILSVVVSSRNSNAVTNKNDHSHAGYYNNNMEDISKLQLPELNCVYFNDESDVVSSIVPGTWRQRRSRASLVWLECPMHFSLFMSGNTYTKISLRVELASSDHRSTSSSDDDITFSSNSSASLRMVNDIKLCRYDLKDDGKSSLEGDTNSIACNVGCIDDYKSNKDPQAKCASRCNVGTVSKHYERFQERNIWIPNMEDYSKKSQRHGFLKGRDLSMCLMVSSYSFLSSLRLLEWIEYHLFIGFDTIYVLDRYGYQSVPLLQSFINNKRVIHIPFPLLSTTTGGGGGDDGGIDSINDASSASRYTEQLAAYSKCLSIGRKRNDSYMAFMNPNEFIRYPYKKAGFVRNVLSELLSKYQESNVSRKNETINIVTQNKGENIVPDTILLDQNKIKVKSVDKGYILGHTMRQSNSLIEQVSYSRDDGKLCFENALVQPHQIGIYFDDNDVLSANYFHMDHADVVQSKKEQKTNKRAVLSSLVAPSKLLTIFHYFDEHQTSSSFLFSSSLWKKENPEIIIQHEDSKIRDVEDNSLRWIYDIIKGQMISTNGYKALISLQQQDLLQQHQLVEPSSSLVTRSDHHHDDNIVISSKQKKLPTLLVGILTYCSHRDRRDAIRQTWLSQDTLENISNLMLIKFKFIMGETPTNEQSLYCTSNSLNEEQSIDDDMLFLENTPERWDLLVRKVLGFIKWSSSTTIFDDAETSDTDSNKNTVLPDYILKTDDDSYVNLSVIVSRLVQTHDDDKNNNYPINNNNNNNNANPPLEKVSSIGGTYPMYIGQLGYRNYFNIANLIESEGGGRWSTTPEVMSTDLQMFATGSGYVLNKPLIEHISSQQITLEQEQYSQQLVEKNNNNNIDDNDVSVSPNYDGWLEDIAIAFAIQGLINRGGRINMPWDQHDVWYKYECDEKNASSSGDGRISITDFSFGVLHHVESNEQFIVHNVLRKRRRGSSSNFNHGSETLSPNTIITSTLCMELSRVMPYRLPSDKVTKHVWSQKTKWNGSFMDKPLSPMLSYKPPSLPRSNTQPTEDNINSVTSTALDNGKDVIVVTGGCHNIGRYLIEIIQQGYLRMTGPITVLVLDIAVDETKGECNIEYDTDKVSYNHRPIIFIKKFNVDIRQYIDIFEVLQQYNERIRGIIHLASISQEEKCEANVKLCHDVNVKGTKNILEAMTNLFLTNIDHAHHDDGDNSSSHDFEFDYDNHPSVPWLIFRSSTVLYGNINDDGLLDHHNDDAYANHKKNDFIVMKETSIVRPNNAYGKSKLNAELLIKRWVHKYKYFNAAILRFTNVYGSCYDHQTKLIPKLVTSVLVQSDADDSDKNQLEYDDNNNNEQTMSLSLLHVRDAVQSILLTTQYLNRLEHGGGDYEIFNIGSHDTFTNMNDMRTIIQQSATSSSVEGSESFDLKNINPNKTQKSYIHYSIDKAHRILGYHPSRTFNATTIKEYLYRCHLKVNNDIENNVFFSYGDDAALSSTTEQLNNNSNTFNDNNNGESTIKVSRNRYLRSVHDSSSEGSSYKSHRRYRRDLKSSSYLSFHNLIQSNNDDIIELHDIIQIQRNFIIYIMLLAFVCFAAFYMSPSKFLRLFHQTKRPSTSNNKSLLSTQFVRSVKMRSD